MKIAADSLVFLIPLLVITGLLWIMGLMLLGSACLGIALLVGLFFRDPHRKVPGEPGVVLAPADGRSWIWRSSPMGLPGYPFSSRFGTFTSIALRSEAPSREVRYRPGKFRMAFDGGPRWKTSGTC